MSLEILHIIYTVDWIKPFCLTPLIAGGPFERVVSMQARRGRRRCVSLASAACLLAAGSLTNVPRSGNGRHLHKQLVHEAPRGFPRTMFQTYGYFSFQKYLDFSVLSLVVLWLLVISWPVVVVY